MRKILFFISIIIFFLFLYLLTTNNQNSNVSHIHFQPSDFPLSGDIGYVIKNVRAEELEYFNNLVNRVTGFQKFSNYAKTPYNIVIDFEIDSNSIFSTLLRKKKAYNVEILYFSKDSSNTRSIFTGRYRAPYKNRKLFMSHLEDTLHMLLPTLKGEIKHRCGFFADNVNATCASYFIANLRSSLRIIKCELNQEKINAAKKDYMILQNEVTNFPWKGQYTSEMVLQKVDDGDVTCNSH